MRPFGRGAINATALVALGAAVVFSTACTLGIGSAAAADDHRCADIVAKAAVQRIAVKGVWACLDSDLQRTINSYGAGVLRDAVFAVRRPEGVTIDGPHYRGRGQVSDEIYDFTHCLDGGCTGGTLTVFVDRDGKVSNLGFGLPEIR